MDKKRQQIHRMYSEGAILIWEGNKQLTQVPPNFFLFIQFILINKDSEKNNKWMPIRIHTNRVTPIYILHFDIYWVLAGREKKIVFAFFAPKGSQTVTETPPFSLDDFLVPYVPYFRGSNYSFTKTNSIFQTMHRFPITLAHFLLFSQ